MTLSALGVAGIPAANAEITITVPPAPVPPPVVVTPPPPVVVTPPPAGGKAHSRRRGRGWVRADQLTQADRPVPGRGDRQVEGFRCALVLVPIGKHARTPKPKYVACGSSKTFKHLKIGKYVLYVRAVGPGGTKSPIVYRFKIV